VTLQCGHHASWQGPSPSSNARRLASPPRVGDRSRHAPPLCTSWHKQTTSLVSTLMSTLVITSPPPPRLCTSAHEGSTPLASASMITAVFPSSVNARGGCVRVQQRQFNILLLLRVHCISLQFSVFKYRAH
jgi:hypothetical protein